MTKKPTKKAAEAQGFNKPVKSATKLPAAFQANIERMKNGEIVSAGRPKGSRNKFAEAFVQDFLKDWEVHGAEALAACRKKDPAAYVNAASRLIPKDFNINMKDENALEKLLDQFDDKALGELIDGLAAIGAEQARREKTIEGKARSLPDKLH